jgi:hypothetical protein
MFVVLLPVGAGMASVPGGDESVAQVRRFYDDHAGIVLLSQLVELVATLPLVLFLRGLAVSGLVPHRRATTPVGVALVVASVLTLVPPLQLVAVAAALRAVELAAGGHLLEVVAPVGFIVLVVALSVVLLRRRAG